MEITSQLSSSSVGLIKWWYMYDTVVNSSSISVQFVKVLWVLKSFQTDISLYRRYASSLVEQRDGEGEVESLFVCWVAIVLVCMCVCVCCFSLSVLQRKNANLRIYICICCAAKKILSGPHTHCEIRKHVSFPHLPLSLPIPLFYSLDYVCYFNCSESCQYNQITCSCGQ